jgi:hypothetical protein
VSETASLPTTNDALLEAQATHFVPYDETERHVESMKLEVMKQLEILKKASPDYLWAMRKNSTRLLDQWMEMGATALLQRSDRLLEELCHDPAQEDNQSSCAHLANTYEVTK